MPCCSHGSIKSCIIYQLNSSVISIVLAIQTNTSETQLDISSKCLKSDTKMDCLR